MPHSSAEGGTVEIFDWISGVKYFKWECFCVNFCCVKSTFLFGKTLFDKAMKLVEGAVKPLQHQKTLKALTKF